MQSLLIDNSNTRTKFALGDQERLLPWSKTFPTGELTAELLSLLLSSVPFDRTVLCSVVPRSAALLRKVIPGPLHEVSSQSTLSFGISYPQPQQIGADRLANAEAAIRRYQTPCVVIDSGTAVTFDVLDAEGSYAGGVIAPGLPLMSDYFSQRTALLPPLQLAEPHRFIGRSTQEAMTIGAIAGYRGLIVEILTGLLGELGPRTTVVATGGDAQLLFERIELIETIDPLLTLEGIRQIGLLNAH